MVVFFDILNILLVNGAAT